MGLKMRDPMMHGIEIRGITIRGFRNNGLFTENVDGFRIIDDFDAPIPILGLGAHFKGLGDQAPGDPVDPIFQSRIVVNFSLLSIGF